MNRCAKCGLSEENSMLYDAISDDGIVKVCRRCSIDENFPLIKKTLEQEKKDRAIAEANAFELRKKLKPNPIRKTAVYNRLVNLSGVTPVPKIEKSDELKKQEENLKKIIGQRISETPLVSGHDRKDLVYNFHWNIMRARRSKKLTQQQLAREISEPEKMIQILESGKVPTDSDNIIKKLEIFLGIQLMNQPPAIQNKEFSEELTFDPLTSKTLTISDLKEKEEFEKTEFDDDDF